MTISENQQAALLSVIRQAREHSDQVLHPMFEEHNRLLSKTQECQTLNKEWGQALRLINDVQWMAARQAFEQNNVDTMAFALYCSQWYNAVKIWADSAQSDYRDAVEDFALVVERIRQENQKAENFYQTIVEMGQEFGIQITT